ncbi:MAG: class II aldolase/adducin family protein, partial [Candidatus Jordarchaeales archaeon]
KSVPVVGGKPGSEELAVNVAEALRRGHAVIVRNHGVFTAAKFTDVAYQYMCMVEHSAEIAYLSMTIEANGMKKKLQNL